MYKWLSLCASWLGFGGSESERVRKRWGRCPCGLFVLFWEGCLDSQHWSPQASYSWCPPNATARKAVNANPKSLSSQLGRGNDLTQSIFTYIIITSSRLNNDKPQMSLCSESTRVLDSPIQQTIKMNAWNSGLIWFLII